MGYFNRSVGLFEESEKNYQKAAQVSAKYDSIWQFAPLFNLQWVYRQKGNIKKAMELVGKQNLL